MSTHARHPARRGRGRRSPEDGPARHASASSCPSFSSTSGVLVVVASLSVFGAATTLAAAAAGRPAHRARADRRGLGILVWALVALVVVSSLISGFQHYLLQRTGDRRRATRAAASSSRASCTCRSPSSTPAAPATSSRASAPTRPCCYAVLTQGLVGCRRQRRSLFVGALIAMLVIDPVLLLLDRAS